MNARDAAEARYLNLIRDRLPGLARAEGWRLRFDHCFARIVLDHVFGRCWYEALDAQSLAWRGKRGQRLRGSPHHPNP